MLSYFDQWQKKLQAYSYAMTVIGVDDIAVPPSAGNEYRSRQKAVLSGEYYSLRNDQKMAEILSVLKNEELDEVTARKVQLYDAQFTRTREVPKDFYIGYQQILSRSQQAWLKYKPLNDYASYEPYLHELIEAHKKLVSFRSSSLDLYDRMLDDNETGMTTEKYDLFFSKVKERIVPLIRKITQKERPSVLKGMTFPAGLQRKNMQKVLQFIGFTSDWGKMTESEHPLTTGICADDVRFTTKYRENDVAAAILSTIHESGHAYYIHDVRKEFSGTILQTSINAGIHESQSRFCENHLGRSYAFWEKCYPSLQELFQQQLGNITLDTFYKAVNKVEPTLVRTQADEVTYPLHIMIRYEIEKMMFSGNTDTKHLEQEWNARYKEYLGLDVPDASRGILQDMHWPYAYFGYFPTYALGSAYAAQFYHALCRDIDPDKLIRENRYTEIMDWLKEHVHQYGNLYVPQKIIRMATGEPFDPGYYLDYLEEKYTRIYGL